MSGISSLTRCPSASAVTLPASRTLSMQPASSISERAGTFTQFGNVNSSVLIFGGTWDQRGGTLTAPSLPVGFNGTAGTFLLSGGTIISTLGIRVGDQSSTG